MADIIPIIVGSALVLFAAFVLYHIFKPKNKVITYPLIPADIAAKPAAEPDINSLKPDNTRLEEPAAKSVINPQKPDNTLSKESAAESVINPAAESTKEPAINPAAKSTANPPKPAAKSAAKPAAKSAANPKKPDNTRFEEMKNALIDKYKTYIAIKNTDDDITKHFYFNNIDITYISICENLPYKIDKKKEYGYDLIDKNIIFAEIYNFIYDTIGYMNEYNSDNDADKFKAAINAELERVKEFAIDLYMYINTLGIKYDDNLHIILLHQTMRFIQLIYKLAIDPDCNIIIPGKDGTHALGTGIANNPGSQRSILSIGNLTFLTRILYNLANDRVKYGAVGVIADSKLNLVEIVDGIRYVNMPHERWHPMLKDNKSPYYCEPSAECIHLWGANAGNWKNNIGENIAGSGQVDSLPVQGPGIYGIITMPDSNIMSKKTREELDKYINNNYYISLNDTIKIHLGD